MTSFSFKLHQFRPFLWLQPFLITFSSCTDLGLLQSLTSYSYILTYLFFQSHHSEARPVSAPSNYTSLESYHHYLPNPPLSPTNIEFYIASLIQFRSHPYSTIPSSFDLRLIIDRHNWCTLLSTSFAQSHTIYFSSSSSILVHSYTSSISPFHTTSYPRSINLILLFPVSLTSSILTFLAPSTQPLEKTFLKFSIPFFSRQPHSSHLVLIGPLRPDPPGRPRSTRSTSSPSLDLIPSSFNSTFLFTSPYLHSPSSFSFPSSALSSSHRPLLFTTYLSWYLILLCSTLLIS